MSDHDKEKERKAQQSSDETSAPRILNGFECPITDEVMKDPVIAMDGHSYERTAIQGWFDQGKNTSPMTGEKLSSLLLIPNHALKKAIIDYAKLSPDVAYVKELEQIQLDLQMAMQLHAQDAQQHPKKIPGDKKNSLSLYDSASTVVHSASSSSSSSSSSSVFSSFSTVFAVPKSKLLDEKRQKEQVSLQETLVKACEVGDLEAVKSAMTKGANPITRDTTGKLPLYAAVWSMNPLVVHLLLQYPQSIQWAACEKHNREHYGEMFVIPSFKPTTYGGWYKLVAKIAEKDIYHLLVLHRKKLTAKRGKDVAAIQWEGHFLSLVPKYVEGFLPGSILTYCEAKDGRIAFVGYHATLFVAQASYETERELHTYRVQIKTAVEKPAEKIPEQEEGSIAVYS